MLSRLVINPSINKSKKIAQNFDKIKWRTENRDLKSDLVIQFVLWQRNTGAPKKIDKKNNQEFCFLLIKKL